MTFDWSFNWLYLSNAALILFKQLSVYVIVGKLLTNELNSLINVFWYSESSNTSSLIDTLAISLNTNWESALESPGWKL